MSELSVSCSTALQLDGVPVTLEADLTDRAFHTVRALVRELIALDRPGDDELPTDPRYLHQLMQATSALCGALFDAESFACSRAALRDVVEPVRRMHARAPFVSRLQAWPRGYQGDFETVECIWQGAAGGSDVTSRCLDRLALASPIAQQHRNKVFEQARQIRSAVQQKPARILVLACGGCPDVRHAGLTPCDLEDVEFILTDSDSAALDHAARALVPIAGRFQFQCNNALRALRHCTGHFDLILAGGLFDYLTDRSAQRLIGLATSRLTTNGQFFFTNIAAGNPYRTWIEYFGDWRLVERSDRDIRRLVAAVNDSQVSVRRDATGLALLASVSRTARPNTLRRAEVDLSEMPNDCE